MSRPSSPKLTTPRLFRPASALLVMPGLAACSYEAMYQSIRLDGLRGCEEIPIAQQAGCKAQYRKDYATYVRERDALQRC